MNRWSIHSLNKSLNNKECYIFSQGIGTDEDTLIEILASRTNREILDIKKAYKEGQGTLWTASVQTWQ